MDSKGREEFRRISWVNARTSSERTGASLKSTTGVAEVVADEGLEGLEALRLRYGDRAPSVSLTPEGSLEHGVTYRHGTVHVEVLKSLGGPSQVVTAYHLPVQKALIPGPLVFVETHPDLTGSDLEVWAASLISLSSMDLDVVLPGKGSAGGKELIQGSLNYLRSFSEQVAAVEPKDQLLTEAVRDSLTLAIQGSYPHWEGAEVLPTSVAAEWVRQGGLLPAAPAEDFGEAPGQGAPDSEARVAPEAPTPTPEALKADIRW